MVSYEFYRIVVVNDQYGGCCGSANNPVFHILTQTCTLRTKKRIEEITWTNNTGRACDEHQYERFLCSRR
jgi:hypothetical protein